MRGGGIGAGLPSNTLCKYLMYTLIGLVFCFFVFHKKSVESDSSSLKKLRGGQNSNSNQDGSMSKSMAGKALKRVSKMSFPPIIYGTAWKKEKTKELVELAVRQGFRAIDVACQPKHYNEPGVGDALAVLYEHGVVTRSELFLQTKFTQVRGQDPTSIPYDATKPFYDQVMESFSVSLKNLGTDYLDSLVLHSPYTKLADTLIVWKAFEDIYKTGAAKAIGLSNVYDMHVLRDVYEAAEIKPTVLQNRFYAKTGYDVEIREFCMEKGIKYESFWTLTANPKIFKSQTISDMAAKHGKTNEQIFFKFIQMLGITPLSGTKSQKHMEEDIDIAYGTFLLSEAEVEAIMGQMDL